MAGQTNAKPVIIKRKKIIAGGQHHGGAWKVAYADFVTAMMAFFLLMWLINATSEQQRQGIADFFNPMIAVQRVSGGGEGAFGGDSIHAEQVLAQDGSAAPMMQATDAEQSGADTNSAAEQKALVELQSALKAVGGESMTMERLMRHVVTRLTDEGLVVEIFDLPGSDLFEPGTAQPRQVLRDLAAVVAGVFNLASNDIASHGFVMTYPITLIDNPAWQLSIDRAQAARALLVQVGVDSLRMFRVAGMADRKPAVPDGGAVRNNRLELILLRKRH